MALIPSRAWGFIRVGLFGHYGVRADSLPTGGDFPALGAGTFESPADDAVELVAVPATLPAQGDLVVYSNNAYTHGPIASPPDAWTCSLFYFRSGESGAQEAADSPFTVTDGEAGGGVLDATESGADTAAFAGALFVSGALAATESGADTAAIVGAGADPEITGDLAATESGADTAAIGGAVFVAGVLAAMESGSDSAAFSGSILVSGALAATESGADTAAFFESVGVTTGDLAATESGADTAAFSGLSLAYGVTSSSMFLPLRFFGTGVASSVANNTLDELKSLLPRQPQKVVLPDGTMDPAWYRFMDYMVNNYFGSLSLPTIESIVAQVEEGMAASNTATQTTALLAQQTQANAEALAATVEVVTNNALTGAAQIPAVSRSYLEP